jgi:hypothetical protein
MGTTSTTKFIKNVSGTLTEQAALTTSAGAGDAQALPALNASGFLDATIVNAKTISAGAGDVGKVTQLDSTGRLDTSVMPVGIVADTAAIVASETLSAGDLINLWNNASVVNCRKADASVTGKEAQGFVLSTFTSGSVASVYFEGPNTQVTGLLGGRQFLSASIPGKTSASAPTASGNIIQVVGFATSATVLNFQSGTPIALA